MDDQTTLTQRLKELLKQLLKGITEEDEGQKMSFFAKAISSSRNLIRALIIIIVAFFIVRTLTFQIIDRLVVQVDEITFSSEGNPVIKIGGKKQTLQVVSVPGYQKWTSSGITLDKKTKIQIRATGSVATGLAVPRYLEEELYQEFNSELGWRLSRLEFNEDTYLGWREPDGKLLQEYASNNPTDNIYGYQCIDKQSKNKKLAPNLEYGTLLGFVVRNSEKSFNKLFNDEYNEKFFFRIGKQADIEFNPEDNSYYVIKEEGEDQKISIFRDGSLKKSTLYFTINDTLIKDKKELEFLTECLQKESNIPKRLEKYIQQKKERYQNIYEKLEHSEAIWFMDNSGDFTVTIITRE